jgi:hypothetical protein
MAAKSAAAQIAVAAIVHTTEEERTAGTVILGRGIGTNS